MANQPLPNRVKRMLKVDSVDDMYHILLNEGEVKLRNLRHFHDLIPSNPRCIGCHTPFGGFGGALARFGVYGSLPSHKNPRFCTACDMLYTKYPGGAEVVLTMLFADVRGSTSIAEKMESVEFSRLMNRFYEATIDVLVKTNALVDKLVGDEVTALFIPGYAGRDHAARAVEAGQAILRATGHGDHHGPWVPVGVGIHTGKAWVGTIAGTSGIGADFTALGDNVNITARLASKAGVGEVLISEAAYNAAHLTLGNLEKRHLELKGKSETVNVFVLHER